MPDEQDPTIDGQETFAQWFDAQMSKVADRDWSAGHMSDFIAGELPGKFNHEVTRTGLSRSVEGWLRTRSYVPDRSTPDVDGGGGAARRPLTQLTLPGMAEWVLAHLEQVAADRAAVDARVLEWCEANGGTEADVWAEVKRLRGAKAAAQ